MESLGRQLGSHCRRGTRLYLQGDLGAGKTTLVRGVLRARGYAGKVRSPTYTLVEPYELAEAAIYHFDLYRLHQPDELEDIGFRDYFDPRAIVLLEWPEKAAGLLPPPDILIHIHLCPPGRRVLFYANSATGEELITDIQ